MQSTWCDVNYQACIASLLGCQLCLQVGASYAQLASLFPWPCFGLVSALFWPCFGPALAFLWPCFSLSVMQRNKPCTKMLQAQHASGGTC